MPKYTLQLFKSLLDKQPIGVEENIFSEAKKDYDRLAQPGASVEEIEKAMIEFGKRVWPYWQAEFAWLEKYGKEKEHEEFLSRLPDDLKAKWEEFESAGGDMHDYRQGERYEATFSAEEDYLIEEALVEVKQVVSEYVQQLAKGEKKEEYNGLVQEKQLEEQGILAKLDELRKLKELGDKWDEEIDKEIYFFEKGLAELEERPTIKKVQEKIDWYQGQIEVGNK